LGSLQKIFGKTSVIGFVMRKPGREPKTN